MNESGLSQQPVNFQFRYGTMPSRYFVNYAVVFSILLTLFIRIPRPVKSELLSNTPNAESVVAQLQNITLSQPGSNIDQLGASHSAWMQSKILHTRNLAVSSDSNKDSVHSVNSHSHNRGVPVKTMLHHHPQHRNHTLERGFALCGNNKHKLDLLRMHYQLRHTWKSTLPIAFVHCDELYDDFIDQLRKVDDNIIILDICPSDAPTIFGMPPKTAQKRLRSFFCKVAALLKSPFQDTIILDSDTIWFMNPENLFFSKSYMIDGSLFFRDRVFHYVEGIGKMPYDELEELYTEKIHHNPRGYHFPISKNVSQRLFESNGVSLYWGNIADRSFPQLNEHQDSSCVVVNKEKHPKLLKQLEQWLFSFNMGYGDKEIFWISSTLQQESYTWEPFLAGQYGDCFGLILHFDPDDFDNPHRALPMYINAEYMVEKETTAVGDFVRHEMTVPILATEAISNRSRAMQDHGAYDKPMSEKGCTCGKSYDCKVIPHHANQFVLLSQWVLLSYRLARSGPENDCIRIHTNQIDNLNKLFHRLSGKDCILIGCPHLPIAVHSSKTGIICDPVHFDLTPPEKMTSLAAKARGFSD